MVFLKEDGSLDIERINQLPTEEYIKTIDELTDEQYHFYVSNSHPHTKAIVVDYSMEDEIKRGTAVDFDELLKRLRKEIGLESQDSDK